MADRLPSNNIKSKRPRNWTYSCGLCRKDHPIKTCHRFLELSPAERFDVICEYFYCINCLACSHTRAACNTDLGCQICHEKHNTLLHFSPQLRDLMAQPKESAKRQHEGVKRPLERDERHTTSTARPTTREETRSNRRISPISARPRSVARTQPDFRLQSRPSEPFNWSKVFIPTAHIRIAIPNEPGLWHSCRVGLNFYSPVSKIAIRLQSDLQLETFQYGDAKFAKLRVTGRLDRFKWKKEIRALLTNDLPKRPYFKPIKENPTLAFSDDSLADPDPRCNLPIEMELGADEFYDLYRNGSVNTDLKFVVAQQTAIGYLFTGPIGNIW